ncbi:hypothetical protein [Fictibacillus sp. BK138]|uniref:hypothetical protein n=1 Tax=Fictibacillus sp. BK138 TaxID=2512121 RepID=UPI001029BF9F|nr:hypothetical protein [Fictibacillus sp. BK138]RZT15507.1 hypothetical protein EV282_3710 [Fictibacillus sp. BK138]
MNTIKVLPRIYVDNLMSHIPFYKRLLGSDPLTITDNPYKTARFDGLLLVEETEKLSEKPVATILVRSIVQAKNRSIRNNGVIVQEPTPITKGISIIVKHPDGQYFEYLEPA